jgi:hypothetical protein
MRLRWRSNPFKDVQAQGPRRFDQMTRLFEALSLAADRDILRQNHSAKLGVT